MGLLWLDMSWCVLWLVVVFCRFRVKDGVDLLFSVLPPPLAWVLPGAAAGPLPAGTLDPDLVVSEDPVFLAWGLR